jgi:hypothetical protein
MDASTWVPLVTAAAGLAAGLATGLGGTYLTRRWATEDREAQWQRDDSLRWHQERLGVYTRLITALDDWDAEARRVRRRPFDADAEKPPPFDAVEWERHARAVNELLALVRLMAPEQVMTLARDSYAAFTRLGREHLADTDEGPGPLLLARSQATRATRALVEAMQADLGLGGGQPAAGTQPRPAG